MPAREAELARGFVLGEDDGIDAATVEDFRRSGLSHLLAVSGQNVALLALLAMPLLAALGMPLRTRLVWVLGLIAVYVPLAGAGPSIQRAGVMGALSVLATLAGRRASRFYALARRGGRHCSRSSPASPPTSAGSSASPPCSASCCWRRRCARRSRRGSAPRGWRRALAEGAAMTIAATLATAPLIAFHFEAISTTTLLANLLALPAVAPAMWLGMLAAAAGQVPGFPVEALNALDAPLLAYIAQVAAWCGRPSWAYLHVRLGLGGLVASYAAIAAAAVARPAPAAAPPIAALRAERRRRAGTSPRSRRFGPSAAVAALRSAPSSLARGCAGASARRAGAPRRARRPACASRSSTSARATRSCCSRRGAPAVLVDGGPPGDGLAAKLRAAGVERLGAAIVTHDQSDHAGGIARAARRRCRSAGSSTRCWAGRRSPRRAPPGAAPRRLARGSELRSGRLRLDVLWPPRELLAGPHRGEDPNRLALVMLARWRRFSMLLTADAEAEATPLDPGPIDVLKVAHHGSDDAGLGDLLDRTRPQPRGDLGRRGQPVRPPDPRHAGDPRRARRPHPAHRPRRHGRPRRRVATGSGSSSDG